MVTLKRIHNIKHEKENLKKDTSNAIEITMEEALAFYEQGFSFIINDGIVKGMERRI